MSDLDTKNGRPVLAQTLYRPGGLPKMQAQTRTAMEAPERTRKPVQRASRTAEQPLVRRTADYSEPTTNVPRRTQEQPRRTTSAAYQQPRRTIDTNADVEVAPSVRRLRDEKVQPTRKLPPQHQGARFHWLVSIGIGMSAMLVAWLLLVLVIVGWTNTFSDPGHYTQTAHLDTVTVTTDAQGHQSQVRAFLDAQGHLDLLVLPTGDTSKARVVVGPSPLSFHDLQHVTITVTAQGSVVTVLAQGPLEANYLATMRQTSSWTVDLKQPASSKGGH